MKLTREFYIPKGATKLEDDKSDAVVYLYIDNKGRPHALGFCGKRQKPDFHNYFPKKPSKWFKSVDQAVADYIKSRRATLKRKADEKAELDAKRAKGQPFKVGDILVSSWGYEQTNVDYYQVVKTVGKMTVVLREIGYGQTEDTGPMQEKVMPKKDKFIGGEFRRRVNVEYSASVRIDRSSHAYLWDGKPDHRSWYH